MKAVIEAFLKYSPRVQARPVAASERLPVHATPHWVFIDIGSTSHLFHGEEGLMRSAMSLARDLGFGVQCAVADTPAGAQAFAMANHLLSRGAATGASASHHDGEGTYICPPGEERDRLKELSLPLLLQLEGLEAWPKPTTVENLTAFFMMLGFKTIGDLSRFTAASLQERWGETGALLWKRLNAQDKPSISPLVPTEPLEDYIHLDFPVSLLSLLLHQAQRSLDFLFARLQGRRLFAEKLTFIFHCENSKTRHTIEIKPKTPSRSRELFATLLESRLNELNLDSPIRDFETHVIPYPEKSRQPDFFKPRAAEADGLQTLSVLGPSVTPRPRYEEVVQRAPRPTRLLKRPLPLSIQELQRLKALSSQPIERLESAWWEGDEHGNEVYGHDADQHFTVAAASGSEFGGGRSRAAVENCGRRPSWQRRDYYFAVSSGGQCLWIYQDLATEDYFLHGYFD